MNYHLLKAICWVLIVSLVSGCSSRRIYFTSNPPGALVTAGGGSCTTPCYLNVPIRTQKAVFSLYSGAKEEVTIRHLTARSATAQYGAEKTGEYTLYTLGTPLLITGLVALGLAESYQSDLIDTHRSSSRDETILWIVAAAGFVSGGLLLFLGSSINDSAKDVMPEVYVKLEKPRHYPLLTDTTSTQRSLQNDGLELFRDVLQTQKPAVQKNKATDFFK